MDETLNWAADKKLDALLLKICGLYTDDFPLWSFLVDFAAAAACCSCHRYDLIFWLATPAHKYTHTFIQIRERESKITSVNVSMQKKVFCNWLFQKLTSLKLMLCTKFSSSFIFKKKGTKYVRK